MKTEIMEYFEFPRFQTQMSEYYDVGEPAATLQKDR